VIFWGCVGLVLGVALAKWVIVPRFVSHAVLLWAPAGAVADPARELRTLVDSVELPVVLSRVREELAIEAELASLGARIDVGASEESRVLTLSAEGESAEASRALAECVVRAFLEERRRVDERGLRAAADAANAAAADAASALARARRAWDELRARHGIADLPLETRLAIERAASLRAGVDVAEADALAEDARTDALERAVRAEPSTTVLQEVELRPDLVRLAEARRERASLEAALGERHPEVLALESEVRALQSHPDAEGVRAQRTLGRNPVLDEVASEARLAEAARRASSERRSALAERVAATEARVRELSAIEGEAAALLGEVRVAEAALAELERAALEARARVVGASSDVRILASPRTPERPESSLRRPVAFAVPLLLVCFALLGAVLRELWGARLRTASEHAWWSGLPVLATTSWPYREEGSDDALEERSDDEPEVDAPLRALVADLAELGARATGTTLLVPTRGLSRRDARELAETLQARFDGDGAGVYREGTPRVRVWDGGDPLSLRRACREADRVVVLVHAARNPAWEIRQFVARFGRDSGLALVIAGAGKPLAEELDRVGDEAAFWAARSRAGGSPNEPRHTER
jgi:uncharacterized protein involved in exopolysaccharide biosynthesis